MLRFCFSPFTFTFVFFPLSLVPSITFDYSGKNDARTECPLPYTTSLVMGLCVCAERVQDGTRFFVLFLGFSFSLNHITEG